MLRYLLTTGASNPADVVRVALEAADYHERALKAPPALSSELAVLTRCPDRERFERVWRAQVCRFSERTDRLYGFYAPETLAVVYGAFLLWGRASTMADPCTGR